MSDYNSSLPIRTENNGDVAVKIVDGTTPSQALGVDSSGRTTTKIQDSSGDNLDSVNQALKVALNDEAGNAFTEANPLPVMISETSGTEIHDYSTASAVAAAASSNHDYTPAAEFDLKQVICSASGKAKFELQIEDGPAAATYTTKAVQFNSTASPNCIINLSVPLVVATGVKVRVIRTNKDNQSQDVYSTIVGVE